MAREDFRQRLANAITFHLDKDGTLPWQQGWPAMSIRPFNASTGEKIRAGNALNLMLEQARLGSDDPRWLTLKQANDAGYRVRKDAKASYVEYWDFEWSQPSGDEASKRQGRVFYAPVFNAQDIVGIAPFQRDLEWKAGAVIEQLVRATGARIAYMTSLQNQPAGSAQRIVYDAELDRLVLPAVEQFERIDDYYATVLKGLARWTSHPDRLNRLTAGQNVDLSTPVGAKELLRAEMAALFIGSMVGVAAKTDGHSAQDPAGWLKLIKSDKHEVFRAARDAEKIVEHLFGHAPDLRDLVERQLVEGKLDKSEPKPRPLGSGILPGLPNFKPETPQLVVPGTGRHDERWAAFASTVHAQAVKAGVGEPVVVGALDMVEPQFSSFMDAAEQNGYNAQQTNDMLALNIIDEMRTADVRQQQWEKFCAQVHESGSGRYPGERLELALQEMGQRYQTVIGQSAQENWSREHTDAAIQGLIFGDEGRRPISPEFVDELVATVTAKQETAANHAEPEDDFYLSPIGLADLSDDEKAVLEYAESDPSNAP